MTREFKCPSCGAANVVTNPGILMKVCDFCRTAIYWDKESALRAGKKSMELPRSSRFRVGATGKLGKHKFTVLGRLRYAHEKGEWDEWFIELQGGRIQWLAEDEGELFLEKPLKLTSEVPPYGKLEPGMQIALNDRTGVVEEIGEARCLGGEGQIPFQVEIGETYPYADGTGADGDFIFGLEYDTESGVPSAFIGKVISPRESSAPAGAGDAPEERVAREIRCASCGKPYEGRRLESTEMVVCDACGSGLQLDEAETKVVGKNIGSKPLFTFETGTPITLDKIRYEVMGRLRYVERDDGDIYLSDEYVLFNPDKGYLWLSEEDGHFTVSEPFHQRIRIPRTMPKTKVKVGRETYRVYDWGTVRLEWVDGALPWTASVGERTEYVHLIKPPQYIDQEITGKELELFRGRYVGNDEMKAAVPKEIMLRAPRGVYSCQPYSAPSWMKGWGLIGLVFLVLNIVLFFYGAAAEKSKMVLQETIPAAKYTKEYMTKPFKVEKDGDILRLKGAAPLNNSWLALDFALVDAEDRVIGEFGEEASFYHGRDSEGNWSEGSGSFSKHFLVEKAGTYKLLVHAEGGSGRFGAPRNEPVLIHVYSGQTLSWYFIIPIFFAGLVAASGIIHKSIFEGRRWAPIYEDMEED
jgi:DNA-directed RNA polymerase subunit RPC12/RpoP